MTQMRLLAAVVLCLACSAPASAPTPAPTAEPSLVVATPAVAYATPVPAPIATPPVAVPFCEGTAAGDAVVQLCMDGARVRADGDIAPADLAAIASQIRDDLAWVQREFRWTLRRTVPIDVYATHERYAAGLQSVFGYPAATAAYLAENSVAFFEPSLVRIAVSWEAVRDRRPIAALRHELTHVVTLEACAPRCDLVPAWLNEGEARLAEALVPGGDWRMTRVRYEAASMVATGTLLPLARLVTQLQWNALGDWEGYYKYQEAARAVELLRADIGGDAIARLYARIRAGDDVATAYTRLTGRSFSAFLTDLPTRVSEVAPGPGITTIAPGSDGSGVALLVYALPPDARATLVLPGGHETEELLVSPQGASFLSLGTTYPPGVYTISVSGTVSLERTIEKRGGRPLTGTRSE